NPNVTVDASNCIAGCPDPSFGPSAVLDLASRTTVLAQGVVTLPPSGANIQAIALQNFAGEQQIVGLIWPWTLVGYRFTSGGAELNPEFGSAGFVTKAIKFGAAYHLVAQPDNRLLVAGSLSSTRQGNTTLTVVRYTPDGRTDASFGQNGAVSLPTFSGASAVCLQPDGTILIAVSGVLTGRVIRLTASGVLDTSFGIGGLAAVTGTSGLSSLTLQPVTNADGNLENKIVASGWSDASVNGTFRTKGSLVRLNADGTRDWTFAGGSGAAEMDVADAHGVSFKRVALASASRIVVAGTIAYRLSNNSLDQHVLVARYDSGGLPDPDFGTFTRTTPAMVTDDAAVDADGRILVVGHPGAGRGLLAWRLLDTGGADPTFGENGLMANITMYPGLSEGSHVAVVDGGSKFLVGGGAIVQQGKRTLTEVAALGRFLQ
ncbi:MAG: hypothetical protein ACM3NQ_16380, partial [Bacteroidales bacterium]